MDDQDKSASRRAKGTLPSLPSIPKAIQSVVRRGGKRERSPAPARAEEGERFLAELKRQAQVLFGGILPLGPQAVMQFLSIQSEMIQKAETRPGASAPVLDLLLRLSEGVGLNSGYARILRGATIAFSELGFENARIEEILKAGDVSPRTFYQFFRNKYEVLTAISDLFLTVVVALARKESEREAPPEEQLRRIVQILIGGMALIEKMALVVVSEVLRPGTAMAPLYDRFLGEMMTILGRIYARQPGEGPDDLWIRVHIIASMGALIELRLSSRSTTDELRRAEEIVLGLLRRS